jgi:hypothetical protein
MGVEPTTGAWEATVLPLHYGRNAFRTLHEFYTTFGVMQALLRIF